jgi:aspartate kinase
MSIIIQKFGGTSVANIERIRQVAELVKTARAGGHKIVVVVSAMSGTTDQLISWANSVNSDSQSAEFDVVVSTGEQITCGLLALALNNIGIKARSLLSWQVPIKTNQAYSKARIISIDSASLTNSLIDYEVVVVPGFQGVDTDNRITTLGRGGSDTTAVAIAAAMKAERCDIYTDVDGVYTTDPRIVTKARKLDKISYEEMLEMASLGAKVLQTRSVEIAMKYHVPVQVLSSFSNRSGTLVLDEDKEMEKRMITGIAYSRNEARVTLFGIGNHPWLASTIFSPLADEHINVDMIVQNISTTDKVDITFTVYKNDLNRTLALLSENKDNIKYSDVNIDINVTKISIVGVGMRSHAGVAQMMFTTLAEKGINTSLISTSEIKISVLIPEEYTELAIRALHTAFGLDSEEDIND